MKTSNRPKTWKCKQKMLNGHRIWHSRYYRVEDQSLTPFHTRISIKGPVLKEVRGSALTPHAWTKKSLTPITGDLHHGLWLRVQMDRLTWTKLATNSKFGLVGLHVVGLGSVMGWDFPTQNKFGLSSGWLFGKLTRTEPNRQVYWHISLQ